MSTQLLRVLAVLIVVGVTVAPSALAQDQPAVRFESTAAVDLAPGGSAVVTVLNDGPTSFALKVSAALDPADADRTSEPLAVKVEVDAGNGFAPTSDRTRLPGAGLLRLRLAGPAAAAPGQSGWLAVIATAGSETIVARRPLAVPTPTVTVDSWSTTSTQAVPGRETSDTLDAPLPLSTTTGCDSLGGPKTVLVSADKTVSISTSCDAGRLRLNAGSFGPGTYKGKLKVGTTGVDLEIRRTVSMWWPILAIVLGILAAIVSQGRLDQGWRMEQRRWLRRLPKAAAKADARYAVAAHDTPWEAYTLETPIDEATDQLGDQLDEIAAQRPLLVRWLPWPEGFMATERAQVREGIAHLDELVATWPTMAGTFEAALAGVNAKTFYLTRAPRLVERAFVVIGADGLPVDATELAARCAEAAALPDALAVIDDLERLDAYLTALEADAAQWQPGEDGSPWYPEDRELLVRARQYERQASATLAELSDSTKVSHDVGRIVTHAARLASRLPVPEPAPSTGVQGESAFAAGPAALELPLAFLRRAATLLRGGGPGPVGYSAAIVVTLAVGILSGLAALYFGKAWGGAWTDYAAAFVWGYAASTVIDPIVAAVRQLGTRPGDAAEAKAAT